MAALACALPAELSAGATAPAVDAGSPAAQAAGKAKRARMILRMERGVRKCANGSRRRAGRGRLGAGVRLGRAARFHAQSMAKGGFFGHVDGKGRGPGKRVAMFAGRGTFAQVGENIAAGQRGPRSACRAWMHSGAHRANILRGGWTHVGGGFARGGRFGRYFVMVLARAG